MSYHYVRNILRQIGARAGVPRFHAHAARHWCAIALLRGIFGQKPLDIRMVQIHRPQVPENHPEIHPRFPAGGVRLSAEAVGEIF